MDYKAAQQTFGKIADNNLSAAQAMFRKVANYDGRSQKGREALIDGLFDIEEDLRIVQDQIRNLRNLYSNMPIGKDEEK